MADAFDVQFKDTRPSVVARNAALATLGTILLLHAASHPKQWKEAIVGGLFGALKKLPGVEGVVSKERQKAVESVRKALGLDKTLEGAERLTGLPSSGRSTEDILKFMHRVTTSESEHWQSGQVSGAVYHGQSDLRELWARVYELYAISNPLHPDVWPSLHKFENEIIAMTIDMLNGDEKCVGAVTSGGTESIMMAMKCYRDEARVVKPWITEPEVIMSVTAHPAFDKACHYFAMKSVRVPMLDDGTVDVSVVRAAITSNTIAIVGSACNYPFGTVDPIRDLGELALERELGLHVDGCLGGFFLPWVKRLGLPCPDFDMSVPGVSTISADTHKYGYAPKGTSVVLFRDKQLRRYMFFVGESWPGGLYPSATAQGSRPGGLLAATWATMVHLGSDGYLSQAKYIMERQKLILAGLRTIDGIRIIGDPPGMVIAFDHTFLDIYAVNECMSKKGWSLNPLQFPKSLHVCVTVPIAQSAERFVSDMRASVDEVRENPDAFSKGMAAMYGLAATMPDRTIISELLKDVCDLFLERPR